MVERDGVAVQQPVHGAVREPDRVVGIADVGEQGVPGAGRDADVAAFPGGVLEQVVRHGVPVDLAHVHSGRSQGGGGAVQFGGGVGQGLLEPAVWGLGLLGAGAVARGGGPQEPGGERGAGAEPGRVQRRGEHRPCVRVRFLGVFPPGDQLRRGGQGLGQPVPGCLDRGRQPRVTCGGVAGPALLGRAEPGPDADDRGQVQHFPFPGMRIHLAGCGHSDVGAVPVRPQRADEHHRARRAEQRPHRTAGQPVLTVQVALQLIEPHHRPGRRCGRQRGHLARVGGVDQPPVRQQLPDRLGPAPGLADRGPAGQ